MFDPCLIAGVYTDIQLDIFGTCPTAMSKQQLFSDNSHRSPKGLMKSLVSGDSVTGAGCPKRWKNPTKKTAKHGNSMDLGGKSPSLTGKSTISLGHL
jgi:hypothetical protein